MMVMVPTLGAALGSATMLAACGGGSAAPDGPPADGPAACTAMWSGNFAEVDSTATPCASIADATITISAPTTRLPMPLPISITLASAVAGSYTSESVTAWSASETMTVVGNSCIYEAGSAVAPHGDFTLALADASAPHGTLDLDMAVLAAAFSTCGSPLTETLELTF
jgi:hypothetical protein